MGYCAEKGIPYKSQFLENWEEEDQDLLYAYLVEESRRCQMCGTFPEDWIDEDGVPHDPPPFEVFSEECRGCVTLHEERKLVADAPGINLNFRTFGSRQHRHDRADLKHLAIERKLEELDHEGVF